MQKQIAMFCFTSHLPRDDAHFLPSVSLLLGAQLSWHILYFRSYSFSDILNLSQFYFFYNFVPNISIKF